MSLRYRVFVLTLLGSLLVTGCGSVEPTVTPLPDADTPLAREPTRTQRPPTVPPPLPTLPAVAARVPVPAPVGVLTAAEAKYKHLGEKRLCYFSVDASRAGG